MQWRLELNPDKTSTMVAWLTVVNFSVTMLWPWSNIGLWNGANGTSVQPWLNLWLTMVNHFSIIVINHSPCQPWLSTLVNHRFVKWHHRSTMIEPYFVESCFFFFFALVYYGKTWYRFIYPSFTSYTFSAAQFTCNQSTFLEVAALLIS